MDDDGVETPGAALQAMSVRELVQELDTVTKLKEKHAGKLTKLEQQYGQLIASYETLSRQAQALQASIQAASQS